MLGSWRWRHWRRRGGIDEEENLRYSTQTDMCDQELDGTRQIVNSNTSQMSWTESVLVLQSPGRVLLLLLLLTLSIMMMLFAINERPRNNDPQDGIEQVQQPGQIEAKELLVVPFPDTRSHPDTMVIVSSHTNVTVGTMHPIRRLVCSTNDDATLVVGMGQVNECA